MERLVITKAKEKGKADFEFFIEHIFSASFVKFRSGDHVRDTAKFLEKHSKTIRVSARDHFKSTSFYGHVMWRILQTEGELQDDGSYKGFDWDSQYFSYMHELASYHIGGHKDSIRRLIERNPYFTKLVDLNPTARSSLMYTWDGVHIAQVTPQGLLSFKRGLHCQTVYVDDPFQDPENKLNPTVIHKINRTFVTNIMSIPFKDGELHVAGTAQTKDDFYFDKNITRDFAVLKLPAIKNYDKKEVLWPEYMDFDFLMKKKRSMSKWFDQEFMCVPVSSELSFFTQTQLESITKDTVQHMLHEEFKRVAPFKYPIVAGIDVGKKKHPSHISVWELKAKKWIEIYHKFLDGWDYTRQVDLCQQIEDHFGVDWFGYDATRGEFDGFAEQGVLPKSMQPVVFNNKTKGALSTIFDKLVTTGNMRLIADTRQMYSILSVMNDLSALETPEGHGDAFFSILCAINYSIEGASGSFVEDDEENEEKTHTGGISDTIF